MGTTAQKLQAILNSKAAIKTAINNKGGSITDSTPLDEYATEISNLPTPTPTLQIKTINPSISQQTITPDVGYDGLSQVTINAVTSSIDANIQAGNIKKDVSILGVTGTFEGATSDLEKLVDGTIKELTTNADKVRQYAFRQCIFLERLELTNLNFTRIENASFSSGVFTTLIIHSTTVAELANTAAFPGMKFTVYVPSNLITQYQTATNWDYLYNNNFVTFVAIQ